MPTGYSSYTDIPLNSPQAVGQPTIRRFATASTALSATADTVFEFTNTSSTQLTCDGFPVACSFQVVDATSGNAVDYNARVTLNFPLGALFAGGWNFRLVIPATAGAPSVIVYTYLSYFPAVPIEAI